MPFPERVNFGFTGSSQVVIIIFIKLFLNVFRLYFSQNSEMFSKNKQQTTVLISQLISQNKDLICKDNEIAFERMKNILPQDLIDGMKEYFIKNKIIHLNDSFS